VDSVAPVVASLSINSGDTYTSSTTVTVTLGGVTDDVSGIKTLTLSGLSSVTSVTVDGTSQTLTTDYTFAGNVITFVSPKVLNSKTIAIVGALSVSSGTATVTAQAADAAGNTNTTTDGTGAKGTDSIIVDLVAPVIGSLVINSDATYATSTTATVTLGSVNETQTGIKTLTLSGLSSVTSVTVDGTLQTLTTDYAFAGNVITFVSPKVLSSKTIAIVGVLSVSSGTATVTAQAADTAGNTNTTTGGSGAKGTDSIIVDSVAPVVASLSINSGDTYTSSTTVTVTLGGVTDDVSGIKTLALSGLSSVTSVTVDGTLQTLTTDYAFAGNVITFVSPKVLNSKTIAIVGVLSVSSGTATVTAQAADTAGNTNTTTDGTGAKGTDSIEFDTTAPVIGTLVINGNATYATSTTATVTLGSVNETQAGIKTLTLSGLSSVTSVTVDGTLQTLTTDYTFASNVITFVSPKVLSSKTIAIVGVLSVSSGTATVTAQAADTAGNTNTTTGGSGAKGTDSIIVDLDAPNVSNVSSTKADGSYSATTLIDITVTFSESVDVTGNPRLLLETGTTDHYATYSSGTGTDMLTFVYTVASEDTSLDLDYEAIDSLEFNSGTIKDAAGNMADPTLALPGDPGSLGANKDIVIDTAPPLDALTVTATPGVAGGTTGGTVVIGWTNPADDDRTGVIVSWSTGSSTKLAANATTFTTPVLNSAATYAFSITNVDAAGNPSTALTSAPDTAISASALTLSGISVASGPKLTYTEATGTAKNIYYWEGESFKPSLGVHTTATISSGMTLTALGGNKTFSFMFDTASGVGSITYTFTWNGTAYDTPTAPIARSLLSPTGLSSTTSVTRSTAYSASARRSTALTMPLVTEQTITPATWLAPSLQTTGARAPMATDTVRAAVITAAEQSWAKMASIADKTEKPPVVPVKATVAPRNDEKAAIAVVHTAATRVDGTAPARSWLRAENKLVASMSAGNPGAITGSQGTQNSGPGTPDRGGGQQAPVSIVIPTPVDGKRKEDA